MNGERSKEENGEEKVNGDGERRGWRMKEEQKRKRSEIFKRKRNRRGGGRERKGGGRERKWK